MSARAGVWSTATGGADVGTRGGTSSEPMSQGDADGEPHTLTGNPEHQRPQASTKRNTGQTGSSHTFLDFPTNSLMNGKVVTWNLKQELAGFLKSQLKEKLPLKGSPRAHLKTTENWAQPRWPVTAPPPHTCAS